MRVLFAPDSFKGTATAAEAAAALAQGWSGAAPESTVATLPLADGGEGTLDALAGAPGAAWHTVSVAGPDGAEVRARWLELPVAVGSAAGGSVGVIELAESSGITLMDPLAPLDAHTLGLGQVIADALSHGATSLLVAVGGSASTDGGSGVLRALGARLLDALGDPIPLGGRGLAHLHAVDLSGLPPLPSGGVAVLTDVTNPLTGQRGAAAVYGPQKGASTEDVAQLDAGLARLAEVAAQSAGPFEADPAAPGAGAAGGTAYGLTLWGATLRSGAVAVAEAVGLDAAIAGADVVVTGEGRFDGQSDQGKVISEVRRRAESLGTPVALVAGAIDAPVDGFAHAVALAQLAGSPERAMAQTRTWLRAAGAELANRLA